MRKYIILILVFTGGVFSLSGQISIQTEYIGKSAYKDIDNRKTGGRGSAMVYSGAAQLPFSYKPSGDGRMTAWALTVNSSFTSFTNNQAMLGLSPDKIFNNRLGILHLRPVWEKWSLMAMAGAGIYAPHTNIGKTRFEEVLFDGAVGFIWHLRHNLDIGFGVALNSSFGYPMGFPAFYVNWNTSGRFFVNAQVMNGMNLSVGTNLREWLAISLVLDANGALAMQRIDGKKHMFSHTYMTASFQPEFRIGRNITVPVRAGVVADRTAYYEERTLRAFFKAFKRDYDPHFNPSLYLSAGINISF